MTTTQAQDIVRAQALGLAVPQLLVDQARRRLIDWEDRQIAQALAARCCSMCVLPVGHESAHMAQDGQRFS